MKLKLTEEKPLEFAIKIEGSENKPDARLVLETSLGNLHISGELNNNKINFIVPKLSTVFREKIKEECINAKLEIIVENSYHVPWKDSIDIERSIEVVSEGVKEPSIEKTKIQVEMVKEETFQEISKKGIESLKNDSTIVENMVSTKEETNNKFNSILSEIMEK